MDATTTDNSSQPTPPKKRKWLWIAIPLGALVLCVVVIGVAVLLYNNKLKADAAWGPEYSTPGASLAITEVGRGPTADGMGVTYALAATGLSTNQTYALSIKNFLDEPAIPKGNFRVDATGHLLEAGKGGQPLGNFTMGKYAKGQPFYIELKSADQRVKAFAKAVPFPIEATDGNGCRLSVELASRSGNVFNIFGEGYEPNEELTTDITPAAEVMASQDKADASGSFRMLVDQTMAKYEIGSTGTSGTEDVRVTGSKCALTVHFEWGPAALQPQ